ncbi:MAG: DUF3769 domain-containing protein [Candidatus Caenarcaniphilales bacterium]|nr:DUF3769 domain-containing protein [Candidatus Caenarcaniphilales bacterium]
MKFLKNKAFISLSLLASLLAIVGGNAPIIAKKEKKQSQKQSIESKSKKKPYVEIVADELRYNETQDYYLADGNAIAKIPSKDITITADTMSFDGAKKLIEATGNVKIIEKSNTAYGEYVAFDTETKNYKMEDPKIFSDQVRIKARQSRSEYKEAKDKDKEDTIKIIFEDGHLATNNPVGIYMAGNAIRTRYSRELRIFHERRTLRWADLKKQKSTLKYSAKRVSFDQTKKHNNLKIQGARIDINDKISIPSPIEITATLGEGANTQFRGPILGQRERIGGFALGPRFYKSVGNNTFSFAPIIQLGNEFTFGGGAIASFNTPGDTTAIQAGYGSLENRFILNAHQELLWDFEVNALVNQFNRNQLFSSSQVGQNYELAHKVRLRNSIFDERGAQLRSIVGYAADNLDLFSARRKDDLIDARRDSGVGGLAEHEGFRFEESIAFYSKPIFRVGNEGYNVGLRLREAGSFRFYDTGDLNVINRFGPALEVTFDKLQFEIDYLYAAVGGESPFIFDQFVDGNNAIVFDGDLEISEWLTIGAFTNFNMDEDRITQNQLRAEFGASDMKFRASYDTVRNQVGFGINMILGEPIKYDKLQVNI